MLFRSRLERGKKLIITDKQHPEDADVIKDAPDGSVVGVSGGKDRAAVFDLDSNNDSLMKDDAYLKDEQNRIAGNPDSLGGLGKQSSTLGQDQLLYSSATNKLGMWRKRILKFAASIIRKVAKHVWDDTTMQGKYEHRMAPASQHWDGMVDLDWGEQREGQFTDYIVSCREFGLSVDSAEQKAQRTLNLIRTVIMPLAEIAQQQGKVLNVEKTVELFADYSGVEHMEELFGDANPQQQQALAGNRQQQVAGGQPPQGTGPIGGSPGTPPEVSSQMPDTGGQTKELIAQRQAS